jgi:hypothetical protein
MLVTSTSDLENSRRSLGCSAAASCRSEGPGTQSMNPSIAAEAGSPRLTKDTAYTLQPRQGSFRSAILAQHAPRTPHESPIGSLQRAAIAAAFAAADSFGLLHGDSLRRFERPFLVCSCCADLDLAPGGQGGLKAWTNSVVCRAQWCLAMAHHPSGSRSDQRSSTRTRTSSTSRDIRGSSSPRSDSARTSDRLHRPPIPPARTLSEMSTAAGSSTFSRGLSPPSQSAKRSPATEHVTRSAEISFVLSKQTASTLARSIGGSPHVSMPASAATVRLGDVLSSITRWPDKRPGDRLAIHSETASCAQAG